MNALWKSKTVWTGITGAVAAVAGYMVGDITAGAALNTLVTSLVAVFLRGSIDKVNTQGGGQ